ncbi:MAG: HD-GYP domain-containing protein [Firmicutes bacterium]|nr:HD-GYP domain-containing protein [Bacillota bacterium]
MRVLTTFINKLFRLSKLWAVGLATVIAALIGGVALLVYYTGGTQYPWPHLVYLPILLAGFSFGIKGGLISGLLAGLLLGPFMPLDVQAGVPQHTLPWLFRLGVLVVIGSSAGFLFEVLEKTINRLVKLQASTLKALSAAVALRNEETQSHSERVAYNAQLVGKAYGLDQGELDALYWAGILHDLGKISTPDSILLKQGKLTEQEYAVIKEHPKVGADLLSSISWDFEPIVEGVLTHHERWDGGGYPRGLRGEEIPVFGRILAVVDVFEALTSKRPYREPFSGEVALEYLVKNRGSQFDPKMVEIFVELFKSGKITVYGQPPEMVIAPPGILRFKPVERILARK